MTNPVLLKQVYDQEALLTILHLFKQFGFGGIIFREKVATILLTMIEKETWIPQETSAEVADMISSLRDIDPVKFEPLFNKLLEEFRTSVNESKCTSRHLARIYLSFMAIYSRGKVDGEAA